MQSTVSGSGNLQAAQPAQPRLQDERHGHAHLRDPGTAGRRRASCWRRSTRRAPKSRSNRPRPPCSPPKPTSPRRKKPTAKPRPAPAAARAPAAPASTASAHEPSRLADARRGLRPPTSTTGAPASTAPTSTTPAASTAPASTTPTAGTNRPAPLPPHRPPRRPPRPPRPRPRRARPRRAPERRTTTTGRAPSTDATTASEREEQGNQHRLVLLESDDQHRHPRSEPRLRQGGRQERQADGPERRTGRPGHQAVRA